MCLLDNCFAKSLTNNKGKTYHSFIGHSLDVAACMQTILQKNLFKAKEVAQTLGMGYDFFSRFMCFGAVIHDLGKIATPFQIFLKGDSQNACNHLSFAIGLFRKTILESFKELPDLNTNCATLEKYLYPFLIHHGKISIEKVKREFTTDEVAATYQLITFALSFSGITFKEIIDYAHDHKQEWILGSWYVAALIVIADWLGSDSKTFPFVAKIDSKEQYFNQALQRTQHLLEKEPPYFEINPNLNFQDLFSKLKEPTDLQKLMTTLNLETPSHLVICDDLTGSGKTEAALELAYRLLAKNQTSLIFALPTKASANSIYERLLDYCLPIFKEFEAIPTLAHGNRNLNENYLDLIERFEGPSHLDEPLNYEFLNSNLKLSLLPQIVVCTIDQVLLSILQGGSHQVLRRLGLKSSVLIIDEVHSYDEYVNKLILQLIKLHAASGGSVIILSATLTAKLRSDLYQAFNFGLKLKNKIQELPATDVAFPVISHLDSIGNFRQIPLNANYHRKVHIEFLNNPQDAQDLCLNFAKQGRCVLWIRNTVKDALEAFKSLKDKASAFDIEITLMHSRFTKYDRANKELYLLENFGKNSSPQNRKFKIVIATQVVEQSLDLDFDEMISDLAPIDLILQRIGRLRRHVRTEIGLLKEKGSDERGAPKLTILAPAFNANPDENYFNDFNSRYIYKDYLILWRTQKYLKETGIINLPYDTRQALEEVYKNETSPFFKDNQKRVKWEKQKFTNEAYNNMFSINQSYSDSIDVAEGTKSHAFTRYTDLPTKKIALIETKCPLNQFSSIYPNDPFYRASSIALPFSVYKSLTDKFSDLVIPQDQVTISQKFGHKFKDLTFVQLDPRIYTYESGLMV